MKKSPTISEKRLEELLSKKIEFLTGNKKSAEFEIGPLIKSIYEDKDMQDHTKANLLFYLGLKIGKVEREEELLLQQMEEDKISKDKQGAMYG